MTTIQKQTDDFLCKYVPAACRSEAREVLCALVNRAEMNARRDEVQRGLDAASAREEAAHARG